MNALSRYLFPLLIAGLLAATLPASAALVAADDFDDTDGTLLNGKTPDVGANWRVLQGEGDLDVQAGVLDTSGAGRTGFLDFAGGEVLGPGEMLTMRLTTQNPAGDNFFSGGYAGFSFFAGSDDSEVIFIGDTGGGEFWGLDQALVGGGLLSDNNDPDATALFTYSYDSGAYSLSIDGVEELSGTGTANLAVDRFRFVNGGGGDLVMDSVTVDISTEIPEPSTACILTFALVGVAAAIRHHRV